MDAPQITLSAPKYLQRPRDPLKDGSIFQMGRRMSQTGASQAYNDTRFSQSSAHQAIKIARDAACAMPESLPYTGFVQLRYAGYVSAL